ncbi:MAG: hypothetical protein DRJ64_02640 [Thermoprotei archaeon]|nr:MAG: hypothetical protein DRJ64_02640 [Thermoprotei archaeon]
MELDEDIYLFVDESPDSKKAINILKTKGIPFKEINVSKNGMRGWMLFEFGTMKTPVLAFDNNVLIGYDKIKEFVERNLPVSGTR